MVSVVDQKSQKAMDQTSRTAALVVGGALAIATPATADEATFLERTALAAAAHDCGLLTENERIALEAGRLQARNAVLRAGLYVGDVNAAEGEAAAYGEDVKCNDPVLKSELARLRDAYNAFRIQSRIDYPGDQQGWAASRKRVDDWHVVQKGADTHAIVAFGLRRISRDLENDGVGELTLSIQFDAAQPAPATAILRLRDTALSTDPWLRGVFSSTPTPPPSDMATAVLASRRDVVEGDLRSAKTVRFVFPATLAQHLASLDPRERFEIRLTPARPGDPAQRFVFEVGDFAPAMAFASLPPL